MGFHFGAIVADDNRYTQAVERRSAILKQMQELQAELRVVDDFISLYNRLFASNVAPQAEGAASIQGSKKRTRNVLPPIRLAEISKEIILDTGRPMTRTELVYALEQRGIPLVGADPTKNLGTILWRYKDLFTHIDGRGYWPVDVPLKG